MKETTLGRTVGILLALVIGLVMAAGPAAANIHDGSVNDGDEGHFFRDVTEDFRGKGWITGASDIQVDGHCVFIHASYGGNTYSHAYSCSTSWDTHTYWNTGFTSTAQGLTGHWDLDFWQSKSI